MAIFEAIRALADGDPPRDALTLTAADGALGLATSHVNAVDRVPRRVAESIDEIRTGDVTVPFAPTGEVIAPPRADIIDVATITWDGRVCTAETLPDVASGATARVEFVNTSSKPRGYVVQQGRRGVQIATITPPDARTVGYVIANTGPLDLGCTPAARDHLSIDPAHTVGTVEVRPR